VTELDSLRPSYFVPEQAAPDPGAIAALLFPGLAAKKPRQHRGGMPPKMLSRVREHIESHLDSQLDLPELARVAGLSISYFARAFKQSEGVTPHAYVMQQRVRHALDLLAETDQPLTQIAYASGFADQSHFTRQFKDRMGQTPSAYRWSRR
jgi:AraC family transcriptional regulator